MYVIKRSDGLYVSRSGMYSSYTRHLEFARRWQTLEEAEAELCPVNERVVDLERELDRYRR